MVALLANRFFAVAIRWGMAVEESVYDSAGVKQVGDAPERGVQFRPRQRIGRGGIEVGPLGRYEGTTSIGQNQNQMGLTLITPSPKDRQCFPVKRVLRASNPDLRR